VRILIIKLGSIGDIVHTLPSLAAIRAALPTAEISWAVEERSAEILRGNPLIDNLIEVDTHSIRDGMSVDEILANIRGQIRELRSYKFDVALDFQGLLKSAAIAKLSGAKRRWGFSRAAMREPLGRILLTDTAEVELEVHVIRKNLSLARMALGIDVPTREFDFPIFSSASDTAEAESIAAGMADGFAILNPGGGWVTKLWPAERFGELADRLWADLHLPSILTTGPGEDGLAEAALSASHSGKLRQASPSLKGFYELARRARLHVGGDTGPTHIAVAAGTPIVGLFGPTEWWRNGSPNPDDVCVERTDIDCRIDCHRRTCSKWICMESSADAVYQACVGRLGLTNDLTIAPLPTSDLSGRKISI
jgi:lipopolysaccharide heptosyltransferase I